MFLSQNKLKSPLLPIRKLLGRLLQSPKDFTAHLRYTVGAVIIEVYISRWLSLSMNANFS